ncbi:MAG TPA: ECF-type sigma factor [Gemmatimonadales bacterium]|nr:ECF-type sigma factor [Gemmatimonadales bacterium]
MSSGSITAQLLSSARAGNREAFDRLFEQVYEELRGIAHQRRLRHDPSEALNTTGLVHEAYLRLVKHERLQANDRAHFLALASRAMRFILVDEARARRMQKRGGGAEVVSLHSARVAADEASMDLVTLDDALVRLGQLDERLHALVEYRFFGGLSYEEIAELTGMSLRTVKRDWTRARTWLYTFMEGESQ